MGSGVGVTSANDGSTAEASAIFSSYLVSVLTPAPCRNGETKPLVLFVLFFLQVFM